MQIAGFFEWSEQKTAHRLPHHRLRFHALWWHFEYYYLSRRLKNLSKLFDVIKARQKFISHQRNPITH
jgi:hypothetical protein